jgi:signal transduction histidine kinase
MLPLLGAVAVDGWISHRDASATATMAAHQLRTPLTLLTTQVSYAQRATDVAGREESLGAIRKSVQQSTRLVNQLLTLSAVEAPDRPRSTEAVVALDDVIRQVLEALAAQARPGTSTWASSRQVQARRLFQRRAWPCARSR